MPAALALTTTNALSYRWTEKVGLGQQVHFVSTNATISTQSLLASYPGPIQWVCIQYPDPHFKRRHRKRRQVQPQFCKEVASILAPGGMLPRFCAHVHERQIRHCYTEGLTAWHTRLLREALDMECMGCRMLNAVKCLVHIQEPVGVLACAAVRRACERYTFCRAGVSCERRARGG
jgi:Putative methyltransferase